MRVLDARFHLALGLRAIGPVRRRTEAVMSAEVPEDRVPLEAGALEVPAQDARPQVVVDDLVRDAAQELEGLLVGPQEGQLSRSLSLGPGQDRRRSLVHRPLILGSASHSRSFPIGKTQHVENRNFSCYVDTPRTGLDIIALSVIYIFTV